MTTFDEEMMQRALKEAADDFTVSEGAVERILDEARASAAADELPRIRAFVQRNGRVRSSMMAAAACVVLLAVAVPLFNVESPAPKFNAINKVHGEALPAGEKVLSPNPGLTVQGTGDVSGDVAHSQFRDGDQREDHTARTLRVVGQLTAGRGSRDDPSVRRREALPVDADATHRLRDD